MLEYAGTLHKDIIFLFKVSLFRGFIILAHFIHEGSFLMNQRSEQD